MDESPHPYHPLAEPSEPAGPAHRRGRGPKLAVAGGLALILGLAGTGIAFAFDGGGGAKAASLSSSSPSSSTSTTRPGLHPGTGPDGPRGLRLGHGGMGRDMVHGQFTVHNGSGYQTFAVQAGQVTAVSDKSITVKSTDGYTQTYTVQPSTVVDSQANGISTVKKDDTVRVRAQVQGGSQAATDIVDITQIGSSRTGFGMMPRGGDGVPGMPGMPGTPGPAGGGEAGSTSAT